MNLIRARTSYAPTAKFTTWLYRLAHNRLIDHYRASGHLKLVSANDEAHEDSVAAVPPAQREAFLLQQEGGLSLAEIADLTGAGVETIKSRLRYALAKLRENLVDLHDDR